MATLMVGDFVIINRSYVENVLPSLSFPNKEQSLTSLGYIGEVPAEVLRIGSLLSGTGVTLHFIALIPTVNSNPAYNAGRGVTVYFPSVAVMNNCFELSTAFIGDKCFVKVLNNSGSTILASSLVRQTGFSTSQQLPTVDLASAALSNLANVLGVATADIENGAVGSVLIEGSFQGFDTSSFNLNDDVYLGDTFGSISSSPGTVSEVIGSVIDVAVMGSIFISKGSGGGGGTSGATGIAGITGLTGLTGASITGATGLAGPAGMVGATGIAGITGLQGIQGTTGVSGETGIQGLTGILGAPAQTGATGIQGLGVTGLQGIAGDTGVSGQTGITGSTGVGAGGSPFTRDTFTGIVSNGQTMFTLSQAPSDVTQVAFEVNGGVYRDTLYLTVSGTSLTWNDIFVLSSSDVINVFYPV